MNTRTVWKLIVLAWKLVCLVTLALLSVTVAVAIYKLVDREVVPLVADHYLGRTLDIPFGTTLGVMGFAYWSLWQTLSTAMDTHELRVLFFGLRNQVETLEHSDPSNRVESLEHSHPSNRVESLEHSDPSNRVESLEHSHPSNRMESFEISHPTAQHDAQHDGCIPISRATLLPPPRLPLANDTEEYTWKPLEEWEIVIDVRLVASGPEGLEVQPTNCPHTFLIDHQDLCDVLRLTYLRNDIIRGRFGARLQPDGTITLRRPYES